MGRLPQRGILRNSEARILNAIAEFFGTDIESAGAWDSYPSSNTDTEIHATTTPNNPSFYTGEKFPGGLAPVIDILKLDYWEIRTRSERLFYSNTYARGIVRRFVTNVINTGLSMESTPEESIIGVPEDSLLDWAENVENRFLLWSDSPQICDLKGMRGLGQLQRQIYLEALVSGDVLVISRQDPRTKLPQLQIIQGSKIQTPMKYMFDPSVIDGVHVDANGVQLGYWVENNDSIIGGESYTYIPARGEKTGRLQAWLVYGIDKREDGIRGEPLLSIAIQPICEIDKHRDSAQRKAFLNASIVGAVERGPASKLKSKPVSGAAVRTGTTAIPTEYDRAVPTANMLPGVFFEGMQKDEKMVFYQNAGTDANFAAFETAIIVGLAWALEIPPEILLLSFNKNYSASQAAINEWKIFLNKERQRFGSENNDHIYQDWFLSMLLLSKIEAPGYLKAMADPMKWDVVRAWTVADWTGAIKPSTDMLKATNAYSAQCKEGFNTRERATRELTGQKYSKVIRRLTKENEQLSAAMRPLLELEREFGRRRDRLG